MSREPVTRSPVTRCFRAQCRQHGLPFTEPRFVVWGRNLLNLVTYGTSHHQYSRVNSREDCGRNL